MAHNIYLIGNQDDLMEFKKNPDDINLLPVKHLPMSYFPFFYSSSESSIEKMKRIFPLLQNDEKIYNGKKAEHTIDTDKLFSSLAILEESYQPYNNNHTFHITIFVIIMWYIGFMGGLKIVNYFFKTSYTYIISGAIISLLIISLTWALVITRKHF